MLAERLRAGRRLVAVRGRRGAGRARDVVAEISRPDARLLAMERTALNFLQRLSGVATLTARFVAAVAGTKAAILDTRKTTPGWRALEKYAVRCGGGTNHRMGLYDAVLIKDNHLAWLADEADPIGRGDRRGAARAPGRGVRRGRGGHARPARHAPSTCGPDIILVDNLGPDGSGRGRPASRRRVAPGVLLEASGGIDAGDGRGARPDAAWTGSASGR